MVTNEIEMGERVTDRDERGEGTIVRSLKEHKSKKVFGYMVLWDNRPEINPDFISFRHIFKL